jgi:hypothetical protein
MGLRSRDLGRKSGELERARAKERRRDPEGSTRGAVGTRFESESLKGLRGGLWGRKAGESLKGLRGGLWGRKVGGVPPVIVVAGGSASQALPDLPAPPFFKKNLVGARHSWMAWPRPWHPAHRCE